MHIVGASFGPVMNGPRDCKRLVGCPICSIFAAPLFVSLLVFMTVNCRHQHDVKHPITDSRQFSQAQRCHFETNGYIGPKGGQEKAMRMKGSNEVSRRLRLHRDFAFCRISIYNFLPRLITPGLHAKVQS